MRLKTLTGAAALIAASSFITATVVSGQQQDPQGQAPDMSILQPGEQHKRMDFKVGDWEATYTLWQAPGAEPVTFSGEASTEWILGGRFLKTISSFDAMGMSIDEVVMSGYDNFRGEFKMIHSSTLGTAFTVAKGKRLDDMTIEWTGTEDMPHLGLKDVPFRIIERNIDNNRFTMEFLYANEVVEGGWHKQMVAEATRKR